MCVCVCVCVSHSVVSDPRNEGVAKGFKRTKPRKRRKKVEYAKGERVLDNKEKLVLQSVPRDGS